MDGLLVVDKPVGPTSHDAVARVRRALGVRRAGHSGTLDPGAGGVLAILIGKATRLARFMSAQDKSYRATIRLGVATDTWDRSGATVGAPHAGPWPDPDVVERALDEFRGTYLQQPPAYSAKKVGGTRSYRLARRSAKAPADGPDRVPPALPAPASVSVRDLRLVEANRDLVEVELRCSAGFYVRALAHEIGARLGTGAHLSSLVRTASGALRLEDAIALDRVEADPAAAAAAVVPLARMLPDLPGRRLSHEGLRRAGHGRDLRPQDFEGGPGQEIAPFVRLLTVDGDLFGIARPAGEPGLLHPLVVLM